MSESDDIAGRLLQFEAQLQACRSPREVAFAAANESYSLLKFEQAVVWKHDLLNNPIVTAASGLADVGLDSPYVQWLGRAIKAFPPSNDKVRVVRLADLPEVIVSEGHEWCSDNLLVCRLKGPDDLDRGGMLFSRSEPFTETEISVAEWMARSTGFALWAWRGKGKQFVRWVGRRTRILIAALLVVITIALVFVPVQLNALAAAEITPMNPIPITAPIDGVIKEILVKPNQIVKADDPLFVLDDTSLRNRLSVAQKALEITKADSQRAVNKAFSDDTARTELQVLMSRVREKSAEVAYVSELLARLRVEAPMGGVAIFASVDEWAGKPVQTGERIMTIADPSLIKVTVFVAPADVVDLEPGAPVTVFLNTDPLNPLSARVIRSSYEAQPQKDGTLAYVVQAELMDGHGFPRIGMRGTAKIFAEQVSLGYYLFRKPLAYLRQTAGF